jgi:ferredoxin
MAHNKTKNSFTTDPMLTDSMISCINFDSLYTSKQVPSSVDLSIPNMFETAYGSDSFSDLLVDNLLSPLSEPSHELSIPWEHEIPDDYFHHDYELDSGFDVLTRSWMCDNREFDLFLSFSPLVNIRGVNDFSEHADLALWNITRTLSDGMSAVHANCFATCTTRCDTVMTDACRSLARMMIEARREYVDLNFCRWFQHYFNTLSSSVKIPFVRKLLQICGDVELNPGPMSAYTGVNYVNVPRVPHGESSLVTFVPSSDYVHKTYDKPYLTCKYPKLKNLEFFLNCYYDSVSNYYWDRNMSDVYGNFEFDEINVPSTYNRTILGNPFFDVLPGDGEDDVFDDRVPPNWLHVPHKYVLKQVKLADYHPGNGINTSHDSDMYDVFDHHLSYPPEVFEYLKLNDKDCFDMLTHLYSQYQKNIFEITKEKIFKWIGNAESSETSPLGAEDESGLSVVQKDPAQNTVLTTGRSENITDVAHLQDVDSQIKFIDGGVHTFDHFMDRWLSFDAPITWNTADVAQNQILGSYPMPRTLLTANPDSPAYRMLSQYLLFRPCMTIKAQLNATRMHNGTLILGIRYNSDPNEDPIVDARQLFALPHVLIQATSSNSSEITIPFVYPSEWMTTLNTRANAGSYYFTLYVGCVNRLGVGEGGSTSATLQLYSKFSTNNETTKMAIQRRYIPLQWEGNMGGTLSTVSAVAGTVKGVSSIVESASTGIGVLMKPHNMDRPTNKHDNFQTVIVPALNMALGDGTIDLVSMRLDKSSVVPHPPTLCPLTDNQFTLGYLKKVKGVCNTFSITTTNVRGDLLATITNSPCFYNQIYNNILSYAILPTLSEISQNFCYFSGNINIEFLFGASMLHSCRIICVFVPEGETITIDNAYTYPNVIYDLEEQQTFTITLPNPCVTHLTPIFSNNASQGVGANTPIAWGSLQVFLETPLKIMSSISSTIDVTCLASGADNFALYVPRTNGLVGNSDERVNDKQFISPVPINSTLDTTIGESFNLQQFCRRFQHISTTPVTGGTGAWRQFSFSVDTLGTGNRQDIIRQMESGFRYFKGSLRYIVVVDGPATYCVQYIPNYNVPPAWTENFSTAVNPASYNYPIQVVSTAVNPVCAFEIPYYNNNNLMMDWVADTDVSKFDIAYNRYNLGIVRISFLNTAATIRIFRALGDDAEFYCFQGFPKRLSSFFTLPLQAYSTYGTANTIVLHNVTNSFSVCYFYMDATTTNITIYPDSGPVLPNDLTFDITKRIVVYNPAYNTAIPFVIPTDPGVYLAYNAWAVASNLTPPNSAAGPISPDNTATLVPSQFGGLPVTILDMYPYDPTVLEGNFEQPIVSRTQIVTVNSNFIAETDCLSGEIVSDEDDDPDGKCIAYYLKFIAKHPDFFHMNIDKVFSPKVQQRKLYNKLKLINNAVFFAPVQGQMWSMATSAASAVGGLYTTYRANTTMDNVDAAVGTARGVMENVGDNLTMFLNATQMAVTSGISEFLSIAKAQLTDISTKISTILISLFNIFMASDLVVKITSFISVLVNICSINMSWFTGLYTKLKSLLSFNLIGNDETTITPDFAMSLEPADELANQTNAALGWFKFLIPILTSTLLIPNTFGRQGYCGTLWTMMREALRFSNDISRFVGYNLDWIKTFIYKWYEKENPDCVAAAVLIEKKDEMIKWCTSVTQITQGHMRDRVFASAGLQKHLDLLYREGQTYFQLINERRLNGQLFFQLYRKLTELHHSIGQRVGRGRLTREPIVIALHGASGVGKSHAMDAILISCLQTLGVVYDGPAVYTRNFTEYMNGWADQPALKYDDFMQNQDPAMKSLLVSEIFSLKTIAEYNANMPAIDDKDRMCNPFIVGICKNVKVVQALVADQTALSRREDISLTCELDDAFLAQYAEASNPIKTAEDPRIPFEILENFKHLRFCTYNKYTGANDNAWLNFTQLKNNLHKKTLKLDERFQKAAQRNNQMLMSLTPTNWEDRIQRSIVPNTIATRVLNEIRATENVLVQPMPTPSVYESIPDAPVSVFQPTEVTINLAPFVPAPVEIVLPNPVHSIVLEGNCDGCNRVVRHCPLQMAPEMLVPPQIPSCQCALIFGNGEFCVNAWKVYCNTRYIPTGHEMRDRHVMCALDGFCGSNCHYQLDFMIRRLEMIKARENIQIPQLPSSAEIPIWWYHETGLFTKPDQRLLDRLTADVTFMPEQFQQIYTDYLDEVAGELPLLSKIKNWLTDLGVNFNLLSKFSKAALFCVICYIVYIIVTSVIEVLFPNAWNIVKSAAIYFISRFMFCQIYQQLIGDLAVSGDVTTGRANAYHIGLVGNNEESVAECALSNHILRNCPTCKIRSRENIVSNIDKKIFNSHFIIKSSNPNSTDDCVRFACLGVKGVIGVMPYHYVPAIEERAVKGFKFTLIRKVGETLVTFDINPEALQYARLGKLDLCLVKLPDRITAFPDITGLLATDAEIMATASNARLIIPSLTLEKFSVRNIDELRYSYTRTSYNKVDDIILLGFHYKFAARGMCSSVLVSNDRQKIVGLHTTGDPAGENGFATVLTQTLVNKFISVFKIKDGLCETSQLKSLTQKIPAQMNLEGDFATIGTLVNKTNEAGKIIQMNVVNYTTKTKLRSSPISGCISEPSRLPAKLGNTDFDVPAYGPLKIGCEKQSPPPKPFPPHIIKQAVDDLSDELLVKAPPILIPKSCRTIDEAILGVPGCDFFSSIKLKTSAGYPLCARDPGKHKANYVTINDDRTAVTLNPALKLLYDVSHAHRVCGRIPQEAYCDFGKDERLKPGKDMRLINGCSFQETIEWRRYTQDFFVAFQTAGLSVGSAIGINMFGFGMEKIAQRLLENSKICIDGDFKAFGPRLMPELIAGVDDIVEAWYNKFLCSCKINCSCQISKDNLIRNILFKGLTSCNHVCGDLAYKTFCGSPSGAPITAPINTLAHLLYLRCVWLLTFEGTIYGSLHHFHKYFKYVCYGDDGLYSIHDSLKEKFNCVVISRKLAQYGIVFTDAQKLGTKKYAPFEECTFLKCHPILHPTRNIWLAGLEKSVIEDIPNWVRLPVPNMTEYLQQNAIMTARFAFFWGNDYFDLVVKALKSAFQSRQEFISFPTWTALDAYYDGEEVDWPWLDSIV